MPLSIDLVGRAGTYQRAGAGALSRVSSLLLTLDRRQDMSRIPPQGAQMVGAWREHSKPMPRTAPRTKQTERIDDVEMVETVMESAPAPMARRPRHPHLTSLGRHLHLVH